MYVFKESNYSLPTLTKRKRRRLNMVKNIYPFFIVEGTASWTFLGEPDSRGDFALDLSNLSDETISVLKAQGLESRVKVEDYPKLKQRESEGKAVYDRQSYIKLRAKGRDKFNVLNPDRSMFDTRTLIGNGSKVRVNLRARDYDYMGQKGITVDFFDVVVMELVEFTKAGLTEADKAQLEVTRTTDLFAEAPVHAPVPDPVPETVAPAEAPAAPWATKE